MSHDAIAQQLEKIVGFTGICHTQALNATLRDALAQTLTTPAESAWMVYPRTVSELAQVMTKAAENGWRVLPCGNGTKLSWGGLISATDMLISTHRLDRLIDHAAGDLTVTVEAGMKLSRLQEILASAGQFLALDPAYPAEATIGGIIATADSGSWRQRYGGVRDQLIGLSFVRADGQIAKAGGRVVKNVAGYDLMKLFTGAYGTLGIISQASFRVYPLPAASQTVILTGDTSALAKATQTLLASALTPTAVDLLSPSLVNKLQLGSGMGLVVRFQSIPESVTQQAQRLLEVGNTLNLPSQIVTGSNESHLWQRLSEIMRPQPTNSQILCKIGVRPADAIELLSQIEALNCQSLTQIHAGAGLGWWRIDSNEGIEVVQKVRAICEEKGGFLSVIAAPVPVKQQLDIWGYRGNSKILMQQIKQQFDPQNILSPGRV